MQSVKKQEHADKLIEKAWLGQKTLDFLDNSETRVKQLLELYSKPGDERLATPRVTDRVGDFLWDKDKKSRILAVNTYVAILNKNPELATKERVDKFLELAEENDPEIRKLLLRRICAPIEGFKNLNSEMRAKIFEWLNDPEQKVRHEARETAQYRFGISGEVLNKISKEMLKFNSMLRKDAFRRMASLTEEVEKTNLDANGLFAGIARHVKEIGSHEPDDLKFMMNAAKSLLSGKGSVDEFNECLSLSFELYKEINKKMKPGSDEWGEMLHEMFTVKVPELAREIGYSELGKRLKEVIEEVKKGEPEKFRYNALHIFEHGKVSV